MKKIKIKTNIPKGVELVPLRFLTSHFLTLVRLKSAVPPFVFVGVLGIVVVEAEAIATGAEGIAETEG